MYCLLCDVLCIVCVYMCTEQLPPGGYPIAVKYIISYHIIRILRIKLEINQGYTTMHGQPIIKMYKQFWKKKKP